MAEDIRRCIHCGERQKIEEGLQRDFDGVLDERIGLQEAMRRSIDYSRAGLYGPARMELVDALAALEVVVENHPKPVEESAAVRSSWAAVASDLGNPPNFYAECLTCGDWIGRVVRDPAVAAREARAHDAEKHESAGTREADS